jgi:hypothetical protein
MSQTLRIVASVFALPATLSVLAACGARTDLIPAMDDAADGATDGSTAQPPSMSTAQPPSMTTPAGTPADVPAQYASPQDACMASDGAALAYASETDLQSLLVGRWMLCNPGTPNPYWSAAGVGLDLLSGGLAYPLFRGTGAQIVRGSGAYVWRYGVVPANGSAFDMVFEGGGNPTFHSTLEDNPRKLVMTDGQNQYTFAPAQ